MPHLSPVIWIIIAAVCAIVALLIGYFLGSRVDGSKGLSKKLDEAHKEHEDYKSDVREHFQQTSAIMSRLAEDYRDMHQHVASGAERLGDMDREKLAGSASPESLTADRAAVSGSSAGATAAISHNKSSSSANAGTVNQKPASAADAKVNGGKPAEDSAPQPSSAAKKPAGSGNER